MKIFNAIKKASLSLVAMVTVLVCIASAAWAQTTITTTLLNNNGSSVVIFSFQNNNPDPVVINSIGSIAGSTNTYTAHLYARPAVYNVAPGIPPTAVTAANGWVNIATNPSLPLVGNTSSTATGANATTFINNINYVVPALTHVRLALQLATGANQPTFSTTAGSLRYSTVGTQVCSFTNGGVQINSCASYGYAGTMTSATLTPRGFVGFISFSPAVPCSGTPTPGNTIAAPAAVCPGQSANLSLQNFTTGLGVTYQWQSSSSPTGPWTNFSTSSSPSVSPATATYFRSIVTCNGNSGTSNPVLVTINPFSNCYCASNATSTADEEISNVTIGSLNQSSGCGTLAPGPGSILSGYSNYKGFATVPDLPQGGAVPISATMTSCGGSYTNRTRAWIDFNQNGTFDAAELVLDGAAVVGNNTQTATVLIPANAPTGQTVLRVVNQETGAAFNPCGTYTWGETEDYLVNVVAGNVCSGTPSPGNTTASITAACANTSFNLNIQNVPTATGISYQWQSSASPTGPWTNLTGATNFSATTTVTASLYYRCALTCSSSGQTGFSNPVLVTQITGACACAAYPNAFASSTADEEITNVTVGNMNNSSDCLTTAPGTGSINKRYSNYTTSISGPSAEAGASVSFSLTQFSCGGAFGNGFQIYIDYNQNGSFADAGEQVYSQPASVTGNHTVTGSFIVPVNALIGSTRMRVVNVEAIFPTATNYAQTGYTWGETEDYCFTVLPPPPCAGTPNPGNTISSTNLVCSTSSVFTLSLQNQTPGAGITYNWQSAPSASGPWTNYAPPALCNYTFRLTDSFGDGWNGATMEVRQGSTVIATLGPTFTSGSILNVNVSLTANTPYSLVYTNGGSWASEVGIQIINEANATIYTLGAGAGTVGSTLHTWTTGSCGAVAQGNTLTLSGQSVDTYYRAEVICGPSGSTGISNPVFVPVNIWGQAGCGTFCTSPVYSLGASNCGLYNIYIGNVTVGGINNTTGCNPTAPYYTLYPQVGTIQAAQPTPISVTAPNLVNQIYAQYYKVYIDLNNNGSFEDVGEMVYNSGQVGGLAVVPVGTITLPLNASTGFKRMRVRATNNDINSCSVDGLGGEVEDYIVNILPPPQCSGAPTPGNTVASSATACLGTPINFSLSGFDPLTAGYSYVWQTAPSANGPWTNQTTAPTCSYTFRLTDSFGDGWNGALMQVIQGGNVVATLGSTFTSGSQVDVPLTLNPNTPYSLFWSTQGSWPDEVGIQIVDQSNSTLYTYTAQPANWPSFFNTTLHSWTTGACPIPTFPTYSATQTAASVWYRAEVSCAASGLTTAATPIEVISPTVTSVTDVTRCGAGTVQLNATAQTGYNVAWLTGPGSGNLLGTGNTITSPLITQNTTYYAAVVGGFGGYSIQAHPLVGGNGCGAGNMFNVTPNKQIEITSFVANLPTVGSQNVKVWYRNGTYVGSETNQAAWTLVADLTVSGLGGNQPSLVTLPTPLQLAGGQTYGFYFQANVSYTNIAGAVSAQASNNDMVINFGAGLCTAFTSPIALRKWNGTINYTAACLSSPTPLQVTVTPSTPIEASAASSVVCIGNQAQLSVTSNNANYGYSWYNTSGFSASGATASAPITASGNYFVYALDPNDNCGAIDTVALTATPNNVVATLTAPSAVCFGKDVQLTASATEGTYCVPLNSTGCTFPDIITGVSFGGINTTSACNNPAAGQGGFSYFTAPNPTYNAGTSYTITVNTGGDTEGVGVWIDYNQNNAFDAAELVLSGYAGTNPATYTATVTIPANALNGATRMRVRCTYATNSANVGPCTAVTFGETEDYKITISGGVSVGGGFTYSWTPGTFLTSTTASNPVAQAMITPTTYSVTVTSGLSGCTKTESKFIDVNPLPVPSLTPNSPAVCEGNTIELSALNGTSYQFTYPGGSTVSLPGTIFGVLVTPTTSATFGVHDGNYSVQVTDANGCSQTETVYIGVNQLPSVSFVSSTPASCPDSYDGSFEVQSLTGTPPFTFTEIGVSGGSLVSFDGIFPNLGIGTYTLIVQDGAQPVNCFSAVTLDAVVDTIPNTAPVLSGTPSDITTANSPGLCGAIVNYTAPTASDACPTDLGAVIQTSGLPSGSLFPIGTTVNSFSVTDAEGVETTSSFTVTVTDAQSPVIANVPASFSSCNPVTWTPPTVTDNCPGVVTTASHLPGTNFPAGTTTVTYTSTDVYGNVSTSSFNVTRLEASADPTSVTSNRDFNNICVGENIVLTVNGGSLGDAASWKWYRSTCGGATNLVGTGTSITVAPNVTTTYFVRAEGTCNITACQSITVVVSTTGPGSAPTFSTLPANAAPGVTTQVCVNPVPGAIAYQWFTQVGHQSAILFNGQVGPVQTNSNCVNVSFVQPQQNYFIRVFALNACGRTNQANATTRGTVAAPTALTGAITACPGDVKTYNITVAPSQSPVTYNWVLTPVPAGSATITVAANQLSATVSYLPGFQSASLCVNGVSTFNLPGPATCINISNAAPTPGPITGLAQPCEGSTQTYTVAPVTGATSYSWSSSVAGAVVTGNGTSATVTFPANVFSGDVCVVANSSCGASAPSCINVTSGAAGNPGTITGPTQGVCGITANYSLSTSDANSYTWNAPAGATVVSANGANSVNIQFGPGFTSGIVQVEAFYDCGSSTVSLAVNAVPAAPSITPGTICENSAATYFASALGATSFTWTTSGDILDEYPTSPNANTYYLEVGAGSSAATVVASNACGNSAPTSINSTSCLRAGDNDGLGTRVYPNPNDGSMFVEFRAITAGMHQIVVTDLAGKVVLSKQVDAQTGAYTQQIDIQNNGAGLYMLYVKDPEGRISVDKVAVE